MPIGHVTNGVHVPSWLPRRAERPVYGPTWACDWLGSAANRRRPWTKVAGIDSAEIWEIKKVLKGRMLRCSQPTRKWPPCPAGPAGVDPPPLDPDALTIGFARRFVPYKRALTCCSPTWTAWTGW